MFAAFAWGIRFGSRDQPFLALSGLLLILLGYALVLGLEFVLMARANRHDSLPPPRVAAILRAWWGEVFVTPAVFCWHQPFRSRQFADRLTGASGQRGVVLVHGFLCNRGIWNPWMRRLAEHRIPFVAVNLEPVFGAIDQYAACIDSAVSALQTSTGLPPLIVAHSMGGLAVRAWIRRQGGASALAKTFRILTLGTPHRGTALAELGVGKNARQMGRQSAWLIELAAAETPAVAARFTCYYSNCDNVVFPTSTAILPFAQTRALTACAHVQMVFHPAVFNEVLAALTIAL